MKLIFEKQLEFIHCTGNLGKEILFVYICNTLANINEQLKKRGVRVDIYPSPVPSDLFNDTVIFKEARPIIPVINKVKELAKEFALIYLTARSTKIKVLNENWLISNGLPPAPIIYTNGRRKGEFFTSKVYGIVEDAPNEIQSVLAHRSDVEIFIPDWPYNRHFFGNRIMLEERNKNV